MMKRKISILLIVLVFLVGVFGMAACTPEIPSEQSPSPVETDSTPLDPEETAALPSPSPSPETPIVILIAGEGADPWKVERVQTVLEGLVVESNLDLMVQENLAVESLAPNVRIVVGVGWDGDPSALAGANPGTAFAFVDQEDASPGANLNLIGDPVLDQQRQSFMAGYLAALVSSDYKVAGLIPAEHNLSVLMADAFVVGVRFFCGICRPVYPHYQSFPQWEYLPMPNATDGYQPVIDTLIANGVEILYLQNHLASPEMLTYLNETNLKIIGDQPPEVARNNWVGTVMRDPGQALIELWPDLLTNSGGVQIPSAIILTDTEAGLISPGRLRLFEELVDDLEAGLISSEPGP